MSLPLLLRAARDTIRVACALTEHECEITPDGRPNPDCGQRFVAIHGGSTSNGSVHALDERYSFSVTVTVRTGVTPFDRTETAGVDELARKVRAAVHMNYALTDRATAADADVVFVEPPVFLSQGQPDPKGPDWFFADADDAGAVTGLAVALSFGRARRITYIGEDDQ